MAKILTKSLIGSTDVSFMDAPLVNVPNTTIVNRAQIRDLSKDMAPLFGPKRLTFQQIFELPNETGPNGERVYGAVNDDRGQIRLVGGWSVPVVPSDGFISFANTITDYVEVTFYGTGLNMLTVNNGTRDYRATVDGGTEGGNLISAGSGILASRNYAWNAVLPIVSGLALGVHTIKIRNNATSSNGMVIYGFEFITESSTIQVVSGSLIKDQKRVTLDVATSMALKPSALTGAKGGRVVLYNTGSALATAVTPVNTSVATLTSADHTNEEIVRTYHWREFGAGRSDDFSPGTLAASTAFTLEDGTTTLIGSNAVSTTNATYNVVTINPNAAFITFTFVGCGVDMMEIDGGSGGSDTYNVFIDGTNVGNLPSAGSTALRRVKLASGLAYGTHTIKILRVAATTWSPGILNFIVYQPKKPTIPTGAVELADYNVMADFVANSTAGLLTLATGVLRKHSTRELLYVGTWTGLSSPDPSNFITGYDLYSDTVSGGTAKYTFYGTGFDLRFFANANNSTNITVSVDGSSNLSGFTTSVYGGAAAFTASTGLLNQGTTTVQGAGLRVSGLTLGLHTLLLTNNTTSRMRVDALDIITPIHSHRSNTYADYQNTLPVGSATLSDSRPLTQKSSNLKYRGIAVDLGVNVSTSSAVMVPMPDMSLVVNSPGAWFEFLWQGCFQPNGGSADQVESQFYVDGFPVGKRTYVRPLSSIVAFVECMQTHLMYLAAGVHKVDVYWQVDGTAATVLGNPQGRQLTVKEL